MFEAIEREQAERATETMKTWSVCETIISVVALVLTLAASCVV